MTHLLDTSVYCQFLKPKPLPPVRARWNALGDERLAISVVCEAELLYGLTLKNLPTLWDKFERLLRGRLPLLPVDGIVVEEFAAIKAERRKNGRLVSDFDILIAATARRHQLIVATLNPVHFRDTSGLAVENWAEQL